MTQLPPAPRDRRGKFLNLFDPRPLRGLGDILRWQLGLGPREESEIFEDDALAAADDLPARVSPDFERLRQPAPERAQVTWIGHATCLLQLGGVNVLTDPVFSQRASPVGFAGPRRRVAPGIALEDLPPIHAVLISHNHYDHLDAGSIAALARRSRAVTGFRCYVPLGLRRALVRFGVDAGQVAESGWGGEWTHGEAVRFRCVPVHHWSSRSPFDRRATLWCGWVIDGPGDGTDRGRSGRRIFFAGDTAFRAPLFALLRDTHEGQHPFDLALLPIGAYRPRWFMRDSHMDAREAVEAHRLLGARRSLAMHWGTFRLTDEPMSEPPRLLAKALREAGVPAEEFTLPKLGETVLI